MSLLTALHNKCIFPRRIRSICAQLARLIPENATVLDVGAGDGSVALLLKEYRPDLRIAAIEVLVRPETTIPVQRFDVLCIPYPDSSFDVVMFIDVLHHSNHPQSLMVEGARVSKRWVIIKDHSLEGVLATARLRFMDWVGNARYGVSLPYNYFEPQQWPEAFRLANLDVTERLGNLHIYPWPASYLFDHKLQFIAKLHKQIPLDEAV
jgi:ubiquinone/menaquinone biosynthesis C-methylase UbiE